MNKIISLMLFCFVSEPFLSSAIPFISVEPRQVEINLSTQRKEIKFTVQGLVEEQEARLEIEADLEIFIGELHDVTRSSEFNSTKDANDLCGDLFIDETTIVLGLHREQGSKLDESEFKVQYVFNTSFANQTLCYGMFGGVVANLEDSFTFNVYENSTSTVPVKEVEGITIEVYGNYDTGPALTYTLILNTILLAICVVFCSLDCAKSKLIRINYDEMIGTQDSSMSGDAGEASMGKEKIEVDE